MKCLAGTQTQIRVGVSFPNSRCLALNSSVETLSHLCHRISCKQRLVFMARGMAVPICGKTFLESGRGPSRRIRKINVIKRLTRSANKPNQPRCLCIRRYRNQPPPRITTSTFWISSFTPTVQLKILSTSTDARGCRSGRYHKFNLDTWNITCTLVRYSAHFKALPRGSPPAHGRL